MEGSAQVGGNHMSPIGQRNTPGESFYSQQASAKDNGNDNNLCRSNQKSIEGNDMAIDMASENPNQQGSILEKALAKQDQALLTSQPTPLTNPASGDWAPPQGGETQHLNLSGRGNGYNSGGTDVREFIMKQEMDSPSIGDYMQHYHHHGHSQVSNGRPNHDPLTNAHHQVYTNNATLHIPGAAEDHHLIRHASPSGADPYNSNSKHHHAPPWVR